MIPNVNYQKQSVFNQLSAELTKVVKLQRADMSRIDCIAAEMREEISINVDIAEAKLKVLEALLSKPQEDRNFNEAMQNYQAAIQKASNELVEGFETLINARDGYVKNGIEVIFTNEIKRELIASFAEEVERKMNDALQFTIDANSDLESLQTEAKRTLDAQLELHYELKTKKDGIAEKLYESRFQNQKIKHIREGVYSKETLDIWNACETGDDQLLNQLLNELWWFEKSEFANKQSADGWTGLTLAAGYGHLNCVKILLDNKANPNLGDEKGYCPLHWAAKEGHEEIAIELINHSASVDAPGEYNRTPLDMAVFNGQEKLVKLLLAKGANINAQNDQKCTSLHIAAEKEHLSVVIELTRSPRLNVNIVDASNHSPLYYAICLGRTDIASLIVGHPSYKAPTNPQDPNSFTKLRLLKPVQNAEGVQKFLDKFL